MKLEISVDLGEMAKIAPWLEEVRTRWDVSSDSIFSINLCLEEWVANTIQHGFATNGAAAGWIRVDIDHVETSNGVQHIVEITDNGDFFDPTDHQPHHAPESLEGAQVGGLGIELIRQFSQGMEYSRVGGINHLRLVFGSPC